MKSRDGIYKVDKTPSGNPRVRFRDEFGKRQGKVVKTKTERDNLIRAIKRQDPLDKWFPPTVHVKPKTIQTFNDLSQEFLKNKQDVKEISLSCLGNYQAQLRMHILPILGGIDLEIISLPDIETLASELKKTRPTTKSYSTVRRELFENDQYLSTSYRREILTLTCAIAKFGYKRDLLNRHPFKAFSLPDAGDKPYDYWRPDEEDKFLDWLEGGGVYYRPHRHPSGKQYLRKWKLWNSHKFLEIVVMALRTGMRKGEIGALTIDNVSFNDNLITVRSSYSEKERRFKDTTKNKSYRRIEMNGDVRNILLDYRHLAGNKRIFDVSTHALKTFSKQTRYAETREIHFHALRHTFITNLANGIRVKGGPVHIRKVMELAGHSNLETTMIYYHSVGISNTSSRQISRSESKADSIHLLDPLNVEEAQRVVTP